MYNKFIREACYKCNNRDDILIGSVILILFMTFQFDAEDSLCYQNLVFYYT